MIRKLTTSLLFAGLTYGAFAQDSATAVVEETNPLNITGFVDAYYKYDFGKDASNNRTSFTPAYNNFALGMASVKFDKTLGKVGFVADLGFGPRAKEFSYNDDGITAAIKQLYITYAPTEKFKLTLGSWATHVGYELVDAPGNRNYSMSYMFSYGPFFHTGLKAEYTFGTSSVMLGIANPTDFKISSEPPRMVLAQFATGTKSGKLKAYLNYVGGKSTDSTKSNQVDLVVLGTVSDKFSIGYNGTVASSSYKVDGKFTDAKSWWGSALYLNVDPTEKFGITLRGEYFDDKEELTAAGLMGGSVFETTLSGNIKIGPLKIIPELRLDSGKEEIYINSDGKPTKTAFNALVAAVFSF